MLVATLNRPKQLRICVQSLLRQTYEDYEIIIIDQSPDGNVDLTIPEMSSDIRYIRIQQRGLSHARNIGLEYATGDYICLVDDDGEYAPEYLQNAHDLLQQSDTAILSGCITDPLTNTTFPVKEKGKVNWRNLFKSCMSAGMIIDHKLFLKWQFDENLGVGAEFGSGEEADLLIYALAHKLKVVNTMSCILYHNLDGIQNDFSVVLQKEMSYGRGFGALCRKTTRNYSCFWGWYYFLRSMIGNILRSYILFPLFDAQDVEKRRIRIRAVYDGFMGYASLGEDKNHGKKEMD